VTPVPTRDEGRGTRDGRLAVFAVLGLLAAGCLRPRYAHYSVDKVSVARGTLHATGWVEPPADPPLARLTQIEPGRRLVLACSDFDKGYAFEAIVTPTQDGRLSVLVLDSGQPAGMTYDQRRALALMLDADPQRLAPAGDDEMRAYAARRAELERAIAADAAGGLDALASHDAPLFASDAAELASRAIRHAKATADTLAAAADLAAGRREAGPGLRGWLRTGGAAKLLDHVLGEKACTRAIALRVAADALAGTVRGDRELVLLAVLRREDLAADDLRTLLAGAMAATAPPSERRSVAVRVVRHGAADAGVLGAAVAAVDGIEFSADRRQVLAAVVESAKAGEAELKSAVAAAYGRLDYDDDREAVLLAALRHAAATGAVRQAVVDGLGAFRFPGPRARVEAAAAPPR